MEKRNVVVFKAVDMGLPYIPRSVYDSVDSHLSGARLLSDNQITKLDYIIASTCRRPLCDITLSRPDLCDVLARLPVLAACGGYHFFKGSPKVGGLGPACIPTPLTPAHFGRVVDFLEGVAQQHNVDITDIRRLKDLIDLVHASGINSGRYVPSEPRDADFYVRFKKIDKDFQICPGPMGSRTNEHLLDIMFTNWIHCDLKLANTYAVTNGVAYKLMESEYLEPTVIYDTKALLRPNVIVPFVKDLAPYEVLQAAQFGETASAAIAALVRNLQTLYDLIIPSDRRHQLTVPQVKLLHILHILAYCKGQNVVDYCSGLRTLELCSHPHAMSDMLQKLGARTAIQAQGKIGAHDACVTIPQWFQTTPLTRDVLLASVLDDSDGHTYQLVVGDGYPVDDKTNSVDLFWVQVYVALQKLAVGGCCVVKYTNTALDLFSHSLRSSLTGGYSSVDIALVHRIGLFRYFDRWFIAKPLGSGHFNHERYLCLVGFKTDYPAFLETWGSNVVKSFDHFEGSYRARVISLVRKAAYSSPFKIPVPNVLGDFLVKRTFVKTIADEPLLQWNNRTPYCQAVSDWNSRFQACGTITERLTGEITRIPCKFPLGLTEIHIHELVPALVRWMCWVTTAVDFQNHKAYVLELMQCRSVRNSFSIVYDKTGPDNSSTWRGRLFWNAQSLSYIDDFVCSIQTTEFVSPYLRSKKIAEQYCYRAVVQKTINADLKFLSDERAPMTDSDICNNVVMWADSLIQVNGPQTTTQIYNFVCRILSSEIITRHRVELVLMEAFEIDDGHWTKRSVVVGPNQPVAAPDADGWVQVA
jgi:hypothetical protein